MSEINQSTAEHYYGHLLASKSLGNIIKMLLDNEIGDEVTGQDLKDRSDIRYTPTALGEQLRLHLSSVEMVERVGYGDGAPHTQYRKLDSPLWQGMGVLLGNIADLSQSSVSAAEEPIQFERE